MTSFRIALCLLSFFISVDTFAGEKYTMENTVLKDGIRYDLNNKPINGTVVVYYPSGELLLEMPYKDGRFHGIARGYMKEGPLYMELVYKNGKEVKRKTYYRSFVFMS